VGGAGEAEEAVCGRDAVGAGGLVVGEVLMAGGDLVVGAGGVAGGGLSFCAAVLV
jgi:hypothetical protein